MKLRKDPPAAEIPTSSMADIAFLLIIFFMVTAVFSATKGLEFMLPKDDNEAPPESEEAVLTRTHQEASSPRTMKQASRGDADRGFTTPQASMSHRRPDWLRTKAAWPIRLTSCLQANRPRW